MANDTNSDNDTPLTQAQVCLTLIKKLSVLRLDAEQALSAAHALVDTLSKQGDEKPLHIITRTGCSICGTDALNCSFWKSYRNPTQQPTADVIAEQEGISEKAYEMGYKDGSEAATRATEILCGKHGYKPASGKNAALVKWEDLLKIREALVLARKSLKRASFNTFRAMDEALTLIDRMIGGE